MLTMLTRPTSLADLCAIFDRDANVRAFYMVVRKGESSLEEIAYRMRYGGAAGTQYFDSFVDHPRILVLIPNDPQGRKSSAAGAPQITASTYDYLRGIYTGVSDYTPRTQDGLYVGCLIKTAALSLVQAGRFDDAVAAARDEWTSLPGAAENNARWTLAKARELYLEYGGSLSPRDTVPIDAVAKPKPRSPSMGAIAIPLLTSLIPQVLQLFSGRAQAQIAKVTGDPQTSAAFMQDLITKVGAAVGTPVTDDKTAIQAVAALTTAPDAAKVQALEEHALDYLDKLAPLLDKLAAHEIAMRKQDDESADRAAARGQKDRQDIGPQLARWAMWVFALAAVIVGLVMIIQVYTDPLHKVDGVLIGLLTILVYAAARIAESPFRYRFGGNAESTVIESGNVAVRSAIPTAKG